MKKLANLLKNFLVSLSRDIRRSVFVQTLIYLNLSLGLFFGIQFFGGSMNSLRYIGF